MKMVFLAAAFIAACFITTLAGADTVNVGFDGGNNDGFTGNAVYEAVGGNPDGMAHINQGGPFFFPVIRTGGVGEPSNPAFLGDFSSFTSITFGFDVRVDSIVNFNGNEIFRPFGIMLVDRDVQGPGGPSGIFFETPFLGASQQDEWTHYEVTIDDPNSGNLPAGWIGFGDEDPNTFEPILPVGASFATVLASVDEFQLTGAVPGFFFNNAGFDMRIDNVNVTTTSVPEPTGACVLILAGLAGVSRRRNRN